MIKEILVRILKSIQPASHNHEELRKLSQDIEIIKNSLGRLHAKMDRNNGEIGDIRKNEFQVYSQWGDDGIIEFLVNYLNIDDKRFVEFGVENYQECNTRFLLINENWTGLIMDGSAENISQVKNEGIYWKYNLTAIAEFINAENINDILSRHGFTGNIGLLHIDIDGNDYWVWNAIEVASPVIMILEYNSVFGPDNPWTISYQPDFIRSRAHYSNLYYGSSLLSLCDLAEKKGYAFIGCNSNGNNAYFVRKDKVKDLKQLTASGGYVLSKFSESRDQSGNLTFLRSDDRLQLLKGLPIYNTRTNRIEKIL
jgi:hypothetical protein